MSNTNNRQTAVSTIIKAGLIAGTLDILLAFLYSYIKRGTSPETVLQYISKVAFPAGPGGGKNTFTNPVMSTISGLLVHFAIAMGWTILFFILYRLLNLVRLNKIVTGIVYGIFVWAMMSMVILPLWNNKPYVFNAESASINALILIVAIGLPLSIIFNNYYTRKYGTS
ncbi:MAG TPA: hypothetical protein VK489_01520 [Ferruginibacter sp.]|nr:hypothetical protein [Ferruginibacter sp.]